MLGADDEAALASLAGGRPARQARSAGAAQLVRAVQAAAGGPGAKLGALERISLDHTALPTCGDACMEQLLQVPRSPTLLALTFFACHKCVPNANRATGMWGPGCAGAVPVFSVRSAEEADVPELYCNQSD